MSRRSSSRNVRVSLLVAWFLSGLVLNAAPRPVAGQAALPAIPGDLIDSERLYGLSSIVVRRFEFQGNTVFTDDELAQVVADFVGRALGPDDLEAAREALSAHYVKGGYLSSGALLPDQEVMDGIVRFDIVEGVVSAVEISGASGLQESYLSDRLEPRSPFRVEDLRERIETLQRNPLVDRVDVSIEPGERPGEAVVRAQVLEAARPYQLIGQVSNFQSPNIGDVLFELFGEHRNLLGFGDTLDVSLGFARGVTDYTVGWAVPLNRYDTTLALAYERTGSKVVSRPFDVLDIKSTLKEARVALEQPIVRRRDRDVDVSFAVEVRHNQTSLLGIPFSFTPGAKNGRTAVTVLQTEQSWIERSPARSLAFFSQFNLGVDWLGASKGQGVPDGRFFLWLGQGQWFEQLSFLDSQLLARANLQLSDSPLLPTEKFELGGFDTVRGYRENQLLTDNAFTASLEWRIPIVRLPSFDFSGDADGGLIQLVPFFDYGRGWENESPQPERDTLISAGAGVVWQLSRQMEFGLFWGARLRKVRQSGDHNLQDNGIHFYFNANAF